MWTLSGQRGEADFSAEAFALNDGNLAECIRIRGEAHTIPQALTRSITHLAYHVGQIAIVARQVHRGEWKWLTVAPGGSSRFNKETWGTSASRSILGSDGDSS